MRLYVFFLSILLFLIIRDTTCTKKKSFKSRKKGKTNKNDLPRVKVLESRPVNEILDPMSLNVTVLTWNLAEIAAKSDDIEFMKEYRNSDIIILGVQELENIKPRRHEGHRPRGWKKIQTMFYGKKFKCVVQRQLGGMMLSVLIRKSLYRKVIDDICIIDVACGIGNVLTNKGAITALLRIRGKTLAITNAHFAAHLGKVNERNADFCRVTANVADRAPLEWLSDTSASGVAARLRRKAFDDSAKHSEQPWLEHLLRAAGCPPDEQLALGQERMKKSKGKSKSPLLFDTFDSFSSNSKRKTKRYGELVKKSSKKKNKTLKKKKELNKKKKKRVNRQSSSTSDTHDDYNDSLRSNSVDDDIEDNIISTQDLLEWPFDAVIFLGDLNYRLELPRLEVEMAIANADDEDTEDDEERSVNEGERDEIIENKLMADEDDDNNLRVVEKLLRPSSTAMPIKNAHLQDMLDYDQLRREMGAKRVFKGFKEGKITFLPTFKYDKRSDSFDSSAKQRAPAWTDRILYFVDSSSATSSGSNDDNILLLEDAAATIEERKIKDSVQVSSTTKNIGNSTNTPMLQLKEYRSVHATTSDHRPVEARFTLNI